ncbi:hypothetical protein [Thermotoga sp. 38H-to]|uniref:hypothetical protein n=1 Tax=Thermotoga sp. 38H-to TaxID=1755812 RepID=UPI0013EBE8F1|nr:hypothetical protein [Thermotoga sp. 38H-to]KAF2959102.1 hypothetical protein AS158_08640 [Thermotoga sp. 38H-to]
MKNALVTAWKKMVDHFLDDGNLDESEEKILVRFIKETGLSEKKLNRKGAYEKFKKRRLLRKVVHGEIEQFEKPVPITIEKSEVSV